MGNIFKTTKCHASETNEQTKRMNANKNMH